MGRSRAKTRRHIARQTRRSRCEHASPREVRKRERREFMSRAEFAALFEKEREARSDESEGEPLSVPEVRRAR